MLAGRLSDKMSSELGLLLKCNKPSIFIWGNDYKHPVIFEKRKEV